MSDDEPCPTFTPLGRRIFGNERQREHDDLIGLYDSVAAQSSATRENEVDRFASMLARALPKGLSDAALQAISGIFLSLLDGESYIHQLPSRDIEHLTLRETADLRNFLYRKQNFLRYEQHYRQLIDNTLLNLIVPLAEAIPAHVEGAPFAVPLLEAIDPRPLVQHVFAAFANSELADRGIFDPISAILSRNLAAASGINPNAKPTNPRYIFPIDSELSPAELVDAYLANTPFHRFFSIAIPLNLGQDTRFSHTHIVGGTGAGKTTLLETLIAEDLATDAAIVVVDSQGDLINKLARVRHGKKTIFISPRNNITLNIFDVNRERLGQYDAFTQEQILAGVIQTFDYLFSGLFGADLTTKQSVLFRFIARLMLALPEALGRNATILDILRLMEDAAPYAKAMQSLPEMQRSFFQRDFGSKTYVQTKEQVRYRLHAILENPTLERLFTAPETNFDLFSELNAGSLILVDTAKDVLKGASAHFGQIFISLILQAVLERAAIAKRHPAYLYVDEAAEYFDQNIDDLLTETRKYKLGCTFAHQYLDQCTSGLKASFASNTAIKFASGVSYSDARALAADMRTSADFILAQPKLNFALHVRGMANAVSVSVRPGIFDAWPKCSEAEYQKLSRATAPAQSPPPPFSESDEW